MPKMTVSEEERALILKDREVKAFQRVAWNEALDASTTIFAGWINAGMKEPTGVIFDQLEALRR